jgi:hypothetical protein
MKRWTNAFCLSALVVILGYDALAAIHGGYDATISATLLRDAKSNPIVSFGLGVVCGHLFWVNSKG